MFIRKRRDELLLFVCQYSREAVMVRWSAGILQGTMSSEGSSVHPTLLSALCW